MITNGRIEKNTVLRLALKVVGAGLLDTTNAIHIHKGISLFSKGIDIKRVVRACETTSN